MTDLTPPADLDERSLDLWREAVAAAPRADPKLLRGYVDAIRRYEVARELYKGDGPTMEGEKGGVIRNPLFDAVRDAADLMRRFAHDLGITRQLGMFDEEKPSSWIDRGAGGRAKTKYSKARAEAVLVGIRAGNSRTVAAQAAGVTKDSLRRWIERYPSFAAQMELAEADAQATLLSEVRRHAMSGAANTWQAAAWILERRWPDQFGQRSRVDISMDVREHVKEIAAETGLDEAEILAEAERLLEQGRAR